MNRIKAYLMAAFIRRVRILAEFEPNETVRDAYIRFCRDGEKQP